MTIQNVDDLRNKHDALMDKLNTVRDYCKLQINKMGRTGDVDYFEVAFNDSRYDDVSSYTFMTDKGHFNLYLNDETVTLYPTNDNFNDVLDAVNKNNISEERLNETYDFQITNLDMTINILDKFDTLSNARDKNAALNLVTYPQYNSEMLTNPDKFFNDFIQEEHDWINKQDDPQETISDYNDTFKRTRDAIAKLPSTRNQDLKTQVDDYQTLQEKHNKMTELLSEMKPKTKKLVGEAYDIVAYDYEFSNDNSVNIKMQNGHASYPLIKDDGSYIYDPTVNDMINYSDVTEEELNDMYDNINLTLEFDIILLDSLDNIDDKDHRKSITDNLASPNISIETFDNPIWEYSSSKPYEQWYKDKATDARNKSQDLMLDMSDLDVAITESQSL